MARHVRPRRASVSTGPRRSAAAPPGRPVSAHGPWIGRASRHYSWARRLQPRSARHTLRRGCRSHPRSVTDTPAVRSAAAPCVWRTSRGFGWRFMN